MTEADDDLAGYQPPFKVVAVVPVHGRLPLLPLTIRRLIEKNKVEVVCVGDGLSEKAICIESGAHWVQCKNQPLGRKWNAGFAAAKELKPDACLYVGSSDWLSDSWVTLMKPHLNQHGLVGVPGCYFMDVDKKIRLVNWKGYRGPRADESIGIGRMLSAKVLDGIGWEPFDRLKDSSLDRSMKDNCRNAGVNEFMVKDERLKAVSLSTPLWQNKHVFNQHWLNLMPSEKIHNQKEILSIFPEAIELQKHIIQECSVTSAKASEV